MQGAGYLHRDMLLLTNDTDTDLCQDKVYNTEIGLCGLPVAKHDYSSYQASGSFQRLVHIGVNHFWSYISTNNDNIPIYFMF